MKIKPKAKARRGLHLVTPDEAALMAQPDGSIQPEPEPEPASQQELDTLIANGVRRYQQLRQEFDHQLFGDQDPEKMCAIMPEMQLLRERLSRYGVHLRP